MFDKKQKIGIRYIHLVIDDGLYDRKAFDKVNKCFYSSPTFVDVLSFS